MRVNSWGGGFIAFLSDNNRSRLSAQTVRDALNIIFSVVVVLIKDADLASRPFLQNIPSINATFALVIGRPAHRPRKLLRVVPLCRTGLNEQLRHLLLVHILLNC